MTDFRERAISLRNVGLILLLLIVAMGLAYAVLTLPGQNQGLQSAVAEHMGQSGVTHPVTAVLLNFRGYDTLLEMGVLWLALMGVWSLENSISNHPEPVPGPVLDTLKRLLVPVMVLVAAYLLWAGAHAPGGAFQAGAVLGAAGVLLVLAGWRPSPRSAGLRLRAVLVGGIVVFIGVGILPLLVGQNLLEYPPAHAGLLILLIEFASTLSIGATLALLFYGADPTVRES